MRDDDDDGLHNVPCDVCSDALYEYSSHVEALAVATRARRATPVSASLLKALISRLRGEADDDDESSNNGCACCVRRRGGAFLALVRCARACVCSPV